MNAGVRKPNGPDIVIVQMIRFFLLPFLINHVNSSRELIQAKNRYPLLSCLKILAYLFVVGCNSAETLVEPLEDRLKKLSDYKIRAEINDDFRGISSLYSPDAISMREYQPLLQGIEEIEAYYTEIFSRQRIKHFERSIKEVVSMDSAILEIGTFAKEFLNESDSVRLFEGKYWNVWRPLPNGELKLVGEAHGYFHPVQHPEELVMQRSGLSRKTKLEPITDAPLELKAYNALMETAVRNRDGVLRAEFFADDGQFMPFADTTKTGMNELRPYLIQYNSGDVSIPSISVATYQYENQGEYILEYPIFEVTWEVQGFSGFTSGKGIRLWKRQKDRSLKIYREIGCHDHHINK